MFVLQVMGCVIFVYGLLSLVQDICNEFTYQKIFHDMKIVIFAKNLEKNIENFLTQLYNIKKTNSYKQITVIDLEKEDDIEWIKTRLENSEVNVEVLNCENGRKYAFNLFQNEK